MSPKRAHVRPISATILQLHQSPLSLWIKDVKMHRASPLYLDVAWICTVEKYTTVQELLTPETSAAKVVEYRRVNPTLWTARVAAEKPFMLIFAENYSPQWEMCIYKEGKFVKTVKPILANGVANGYWIDEVGDLTIEIRYALQEPYEMGIKVSATTLAAVAAYLLWALRRGKWQSR